MDIDENPSDQTQNTGVPAVQQQPQQQPEIPRELREFHYSDPYGGYEKPVWNLLYNLYRTDRPAYDKALQFANAYRAKFGGERTILVPEHFTQENYDQFIPKPKPKRKPRRRGRPKKAQVNPNAAALYGAAKPFPVDFGLGQGPEVSDNWRRNENLIIVQYNGSYNFFTSVKKALKWWRDRNSPLNVGHDLITPRRKRGRPKKKRLQPRRDRQVDPEQARQAALGSLDVRIKQEQSPVRSGPYVRPGEIGSSRELPIGVGAILGSLEIPEVQPTPEYQRNDPPELDRESSSSPVLDLTESSPESPSPSSGGTVFSDVGKVRKGVVEALKKQNEELLFAKPKARRRQRANVN